MALQNEIEKTVRPVLEEHGLELVELKLKHGKNSKIQIYVWKENGVSIDLCSKVSRELSDMLDRRDLISGSYRLEVSSPGLDRPLKTRRDFERCKGEKVKVEYYSADKTERVRGSINSVDDSAVTLQIEQEAYQVIPLSDITSAKIIIEI